MRSYWGRDLYGGRQVLMRSVRWALIQRDQGKRVGRHPEVRWRGDSGRRPPCQAKEGGLREPNRDVTVIRLPASRTQMSHGTNLSSELGTASMGNPWPQRSPDLPRPTQAPDISSQSLVCQDRRWMDPGPGRRGCSRPLPHPRGRTTGGCLRRPVTAH